MTTSPQRHFVLSLYRSIMQSHRLRLPSDMRALGDRYVREEFKLHKNVQDVKQVHAFLHQWLQYLEMMQDQRPGSFGRDLSEDEWMTVDGEQLAQLKKLQQAARDMED